MSENTITLPMLGLIELKEDEWQQTGYDHEYNLSYCVNAYKFNNLAVDIDVNLGTVTEQNIEKASFALANFQKLIQVGIEGIYTDYTNKGEAENYIAEWRDDIFVQIFDEEEFLKFMSETDSSLSTEERLLSKLRIVRFGVYVESKIDFITLDYAFGYKQEDGFRDDMLVVKFDQNLKILDISTEG